MERCFWEARRALYWLRRGAARVIYPPVFHERDDLRQLSNRQGEALLRAHDSDSPPPAHAGEE